jgi:hypothetical protein
MSETQDVGPMTADEIQELLAEEGAQISNEQAKVLAAFVANVGGLEDALAILSDLSKQSRAA